MKSFTQYLSESNLDKNKVNGRDLIDLQKQLVDKLTITMFAVKNEPHLSKDQKKTLTKLQNLRKSVEDTIEQILSDYIESKENAVNESKDSIPMAIYGKIKKHWKESGYGYSRKDIVSKISSDIKQNSDADEVLSKELANRIANEIGIGPKDKDIYSK